MTPLGGQYSIQPMRLKNVEPNIWYRNSFICHRNIYQLPIKRQWMVFRWRCWTLKYELITKEDIKYYIKPSHILKQDHFYNFLSEIYDTIGLDAQIAINGFIGLLGSNRIYKERHYFESGYDKAADEIITNEKVEVKGIYKNGKSQF